jgi:5-(carboxyamino)imidazole ribonucleotide mutase
MAKTKVAILIGSDSDLKVVNYGCAVLEELKISYELHIYSAHRTPKQTLSFASQAKKKGFKVIIAAAGMSAHLAGVVAAHTILPVIGIPMEGSLEGLDALLSTVQMPKGIPVATVAIGKSGAINAALLSAQILSLSDKALEKRLIQHRKKMSEEVLKKDRKFRKKR